MVLRRLGPRATGSSKDQGPRAPSSRAHCGHSEHSTQMGASSSRTCSSTSPGFKPYDMSKVIESVASHLCLLPITYGIGSDKSFPFDFHISRGLQANIKLDIHFFEYKRHLCAPVCE